MIVLVSLNSKNEERLEAKTEVTNWNRVFKAKRQFEELGIT